MLVLLYLVLEVRALKRSEGYISVGQSGTTTITGDLVVTGTINGKDSTSPIDTSDFVKYNDKLYVASAKPGYGYFQQHSGVRGSHKKTHHGIAIQKGKAKVDKHGWNDFKLVKA